jgi:hypothetical protein
MRRELERQGGFVRITRWIKLMTAIAACAALAQGAEKTLMHCFAWTEIKEATAADWDAFRAASDAIPSKIKVVTRVWYGPLANPLNQTMLAKIDPEAFKKFQGGETIPAEVRRMPRTWGMCMEMANAAAYKAYAEDPYHKIWTAAYEKVRVDGTTTFDILGQ